MIIILCRLIDIAAYEEPNLVFTNMIHYVTGNKFDSKYIIDCSFSTSKCCKIICPNGYGLPRLTLYFGRDISIGLNWRTVFDEHTKLYYPFNHHEECVPSDIDDYIRIVTSFLREYVRHVCSMVGRAEGWPEMKNEDGYFVGGVVKGADDCPGELIEALNMQESITKYQWTDECDLMYMINLFKSKAFKRSRGDYSRNT